jgi:hypothetical protein
MVVKGVQTPEESKPIVTMDDFISMVNDHVCSLENEGCEVRAIDVGPSPTGAGWKAKITVKHLDFCSMLDSRS